MTLVKNVSSSMILCGGKLLDPMRGVLDVVRQARALVFDFDGTLVNSEPIKRRAFEACFAEFANHRGAILAYCWGNNQLTRSEKFRDVYEQILGLSYRDDVAARLERRFAKLTTRQIIEAPEIPGASRFLGFTARSHTRALLSNTPQPILADILLHRGWRDHFTAIQGAPVDKKTWLQTFRAERGLHGTEVAFFGDTPEDAGAAQAAGCTFIGVASGSLRAEPIHYISDFTGLLPPYNRKR